MTIRTCSKATAPAHLNSWNILCFTLLKVWLILLLKQNIMSSNSIWTVIILVTKQIGLLLPNPLILLITCMITGRIGLHSILLPLLITLEYNDISSRWNFLYFTLTLYCKSSIKPHPASPRGAYLFQTHLRGSLVETKGSFELGVSRGGGGGILFYLAKAIVTVLYKEPENKGDNSSTRSWRSCSQT